MSAPTPLPPEVLADALQDRIHPASGRLIRATPIKNSLLREMNARTRETRAWLDAAEAELEFPGHE